MQQPKKPSAKTTSQTSQLPPFPSILGIFSKTWQMLSKQAKPLIAVVLVVGIVTTLWQHSLTPDAIDTRYIGSLIEGSVENPLESIGLPVAVAIVGVIALLLLLILVTFFFSTMFEVFVNRLLANDDDKSISDLVLGAFKTTPALFLTSLLVIALSVGAFGFFLIPGAILTILLFFCSQEVIFGGTKYWRAIQNSYTIFWRNRSELFLNVLILSLLAMLMSSVVEEMRTIPAEGLVVWLRDGAALISNLTYSVALTAATIVLYREGRARTDLKKPVSLRWMVIISALGYLIIGVVLYWLFSNDAAVYNQLQERIQQASEAAS